VRLTLRGIAVLIAALVLYAVGEAAGYLLFRVLAGAAAGAVLGGCAVAIRRPTVVVSRALHPDRVECGQPALARLQVHNPGTTRHPAFTATDLLDDNYQEVFVRDVPAGATVTHHYQLPTTRRGRLTVGPLVLERRDPLGLVSSRVVTGNTATLWVHPRRHPVRTAMVGWPRHHHEGSETPHLLSGSTDLRGVREYIPGDEVRHVYWKAVARTGTIMVREYADPAQPRFTVVLDNRAGVLPAPALEAAVEVTASLIFAAATGGHRTRLVATSGGLDLDVSGGMTGARRLLDQLCELDQPAVANDAAESPLPPDFSRSGSGGMLVFVSGGQPAADRRVMASLGQARAELTVIDLCPRTEEAAGSGVRTIRARTATEAVRAWNAAVER
jgi:uncharacterized protein (DUF58 family)